MASGVLQHSLHYLKLYERRGLNVAKPWAVAFYKSKAWKTARKQALARTGGLCQWCLDKGLIVPAEEVHHTIELTQTNINNPDITLNQERLIPLCHRCHDTTKYKANERRWRVDANGNVSTNAETPPDFEKF